MELAKELEELKISEEELEVFKTKWAAEQLELKKRLVTEDMFDKAEITRIAGVDISFVNGSATRACAALAVLSFPGLNVLYEDYEMIDLHYPYIAGFLAFREVEFLITLLNKLKTRQPDLLPQVIMVDGNGVLHYRGFGLASHLGVLTGIPTIGVGKNLLYVDGLTREKVREEAHEKLFQNGDNFDLVGDSGAVWGSCVLVSKKSKTPVYVSIGHNISLPTAIDVSVRSSQFKIPAPIRAADLGSRDFIRNLDLPRKKKNPKKKKKKILTSEDLPEAYESVRTYPMSLVELIEFEKE